MVLRTLAECRRLVQFYLELFCTAVRTDVPGCILGCSLGEELDIRRVPSELLHLLHPAPGLLDLLRCEHEPSTFPAGGLEELFDIFDETDVDDGSCQFDVSEVTGTFARFATACLT